METRWYSYSYVGGINQDKIIDEARSNPVDRIVLLGELEWEMFIDRLVPFCKENNINLVIIHGCGRSEYHEKIYKDLGYDINKVIFFDKHWPLYTEKLMSWRIKYQDYKHENFNHAFITLNNRAHLHRCVLIDELAKESLLENGVVTWHNFLNNAANFNFKHFDGKIRTLSDNFQTELDSFAIPDIYKNCFLDVIAEATHLCPIMSEKTIKPILFKKPFLTFSCKNYYKHVQDLGFVLYDEIFDYSFDDVDDLEVRAKLFVENVKRVINIDHATTYNLLLPKLEYNMQNVIKIKHECNSIPYVIKEYVSMLENNGVKKEGMYYRLWDMVDIACGLR
ncbi:hypothetical protein EBU71_19750 [bacterium]|nr:hypothetical protein [Candidatus Elulimicrobium humile]